MSRGRRERGAPEASRGIERVISRRETSDLSESVPSQTDCILTPSAHERRSNLARARGDRNSQKVRGNDDGGLEWFWRRHWPGGKIWSLSHRQTRIVSCPFMAVSSGPSLPLALSASFACRSCHVKLRDLAAVCRPPQLSVVVCRGGHLNGRGPVLAVVVLPSLLIVRAWGVTPSG